MDLRPVRNFSEQQEIALDKPVRRIERKLHHCADGLHAVEPRVFFRAGPESGRGHQVFEFDLRRLDIAPSAGRLKGSPTLASRPRSALNRTLIFQVRRFVTVL